MGRYIIKGGLIVTSSSAAVGDVYVDGERIVKIVFEDKVYGFGAQMSEAEVIDARGKWVFAGGIDMHVHFRDPGLTHKADMASESRAALLGGVTTVYDMPNTSPATTSMERLREKAASAKGRCLTNIGFHLGATNENYEELAAAVKNCPEEFGALKVFMGSSTGNMLVDDEQTISRIFALRGKPIFVHCEDEAMIRAALESAKARYGEEIPFSQHPEIRSRHACIASTARALQLALQNHTALHICHVSTAEEMTLITAAKTVNPKITCETSINYLYFNSLDYSRLGSKLKCNPAVKEQSDQNHLREALLRGEIDAIASDHAPHLESEKAQSYLKAPSGLPSIQHTLPALIDIIGNEVTRRQGDGARETNAQMKGLHMIA